ncbi:putative dehydrogenase [Opitutaceae bacterium TAV1]|nr:putative dehydrogenase [Opitutaceae bacterium TAV1]
MKKSPSSPAGIKVGVVGYGGAFNMGRQHLKEMQAAGMTPVAVAEVDPARLEVARQDFPGIGVYGSVADMLEKSDVGLVTVITPHNTHADLGLQIVSAGRHCVLEKPMAITTAECDAMIAAAKKQGVIVSTYHNRHWDGWILKALEVVDSGVLGDIVRVDLRMGAHGRPRDWWRSSRAISGGILYDWGVHLLEYALQIVKGDLTEVSGYAWENFWAEEPGAAYAAAAMNEDEAQLVARFSTGRRINLTITQLDAAPERGKIKIVGTRGTHLIDWPDYETTVALATGEFQVTKGKCPPSQGEKFYQNIAAHLTAGEPLVITGEWARRPIHILDLAVQSAKQGRALPAVYP